MPKSYFFYKIASINNDITEFYIGSTRNMQKRICSHKHYSIVYPNRKVYNYINNNGGWSNFEFILLFRKKCSKEERKLVEGSLIINFKASLNTQIPNRTQKQYYLDNIGKIKGYYLRNKEKRIQYQKEYYRKNYDKVNEKHMCDICKKEIIKRNFKNHLNTDQHINNLTI